MPCYLHTTKPASRAEFDQWTLMGYLGTWEAYCTAKNRTAGQNSFLCGELGPHCADCADVGAYLCDYPVGDGKTCDRSMCDSHAHEIAHELHYCDAHYKMWEVFKQAGGVDAALRNVIAYKTEK
ncbi:hypothetical protein [Cupriavidus pampae]|uniref:Uncharacterized protein n=1 Tax=Cupriavidus pampae TaxID=659251 RepID=A0ABN7ZI83_9BURK|nr:hypothetical protein [Cupriavidus pampae]CAG9184416.1 hypothetical protein LMG32289_05611 [Cupriavidus pampae]